MATKAQRYLAAGTRLVWIVWPKRRQIEVWRPGDTKPSQTLDVGDTLDGGGVEAGRRKVERRHIRLDKCRRGHIALARRNVLRRNVDAGDGEAVGQLSRRGHANPAPELEHFRARRQCIQQDGSIALTLIR